MLVLLANVKGLQAKRISDLNSTIKSTTNKLQSNSNLNKILTLQNQLTSIPTLDNQDPVAWRLVGNNTIQGFITQVTPATASIGTLNADFTTDNVSVQGTADSLYTVNQYADTLKFTKFSINGDTSNEQLAFSDVTLSNFGYTTDGVVDYLITLNFNPDLFNISDNIALDVPQNYITTRSQIDQPSELFNGKTGSKTDQTTGSTDQGSNQ
jgi:hypothetical protein